MRQEKIRVRLGARSYDIVVGADSLGGLSSCLKRLALGRRAFLISNRTILRLHGLALLGRLKRAGFSVAVLTVGDTERSKSWNVLGRLLQQMAQLHRPAEKEFLILLGGGVVGDLGGLAAGLFHRGIPCVQIPTTLLAQVDSSIGGKTAVDLPQGKNLVGVIVQPRAVWVESSFLSTLSDRQFRSGLAEIIKCAAIGDQKLFSLLERHSYAALRRDPRLLQSLLAGAIRVKADLVSADESERLGRRTLLNFGHTFGHALEAACGYTRATTHGEAVALGMRVAADLSVRMGLLPASQAKRLFLLLSRMGLPVCVKRGVRLDKVLKAMQQDKKWLRARNRWVLLTVLGRGVVREGISDRWVRASIRSVWEG